MFSAIDTVPRCSRGRTSLCSGIFRSTIRIVGPDSSNSASAAPLLLRRGPRDQIEIGRAYVMHTRNGGSGPLEWLRRHEIANQAAILNMTTSQFIPVSASSLCRCTSAFEGLHSTSVIALAVDPKQSMLAVGQYSHPSAGIVLLDLNGPTERWRKQWPYNTSAWIEGMAFSTDGRRLWTALSDGRLQSHDVDGSPLRETTAAGGDVSDVRLGRDAQWAVVCGSWDRSPGYGAWGAVDFNEYFTTLVAADAQGDATDSNELIASILSNTPAHHDLFRFRNSATLAFSPDGTLELVSVVEGHEAAPQLLVRTRFNGSILDTLTFSRARDFALAAVFAEDGVTFWIGTHSGLLFRFVTSPA